eukprot:TRINITY_DN1933_c0_g1_i1.p1 TRINITY_DN1933_c0_g1~~TRINITY_DN1933_c0_g1_i1.p1  ORF type:complete len:168 (+),score=20.44 TRINITY_DN1933_c0_g1_i1:53-505(+)
MSKRGKRKSAAIIEEEEREYEDSTPTFSGKAESKAPIEDYRPDYSFKDPEFKRGTTARRKKGFSFAKKLQEAENYQAVSMDIPTYMNIEAPPSILPVRKYCDLTGLPAKYTDPRTGIRYHCALQYPTIQSMTPQAVNEYLSLRRSASSIK